MRCGRSRLTLAWQGIDTDGLIKLLDSYQQHRFEAEADPDAPSGLAAFMTQMTVRMGLHAAHAVPGVGGLADVVDAAAVAAQAEQLRVFLAKKFRRHEDVRLLLSPLVVLTPALVRDFAQAGRRGPLALFFDTYEQTGLVLDGWLRSVLDGAYGELPEDLVLTVAGRSPLDPGAWSAYLPVMADVPLEPFTDTEARQFLAERGITDDRVTQVIINVSGRLPLLLATLAENHPSDPDLVGDPTGNAVERFLKWESDPARRALAVAGALPRILDEDILTVLLAAEDVDQRSRLFAWLNHSHSSPTTPGAVSTMMWSARPWSGWSDASPRSGGRNAIMRWQPPTSHGGQASSHKTPGTSKDGAPSAWRRPITGCVRTRAQPCPVPWLRSSTRVPNSPQLLHSGRRPLLRLARIRTPRRYRHAVSGSKMRFAWTSTRLRLPAWTSFFRRIGFRTMFSRSHYGPGGGPCTTSTVTPRHLFDLNKAIALTPEDSRALAYRGAAHLWLDRYPEALADLDKAIELDPDYQWAIARRGETYRQMDRYEQALADFDKAIELNLGWQWVIAIRAEIYRQMGRYEQALADFDKAIELDPSSDWVIANRGETYRQMGRYEQALADFGKAIELDPSYQWAIAQRGETYRQMGRYEQALADLGKAIELDPSSDWVIANRGETYRQMGRYEQALADFGKAIELDPDYQWAIAQRGETYRQMGRYEQALADLGKAIELDPSSDWVIASRGETYRQMGRYEQALADFGKAIELDPDYQWAIAQRGETYRQMGRYEQALADLGKAIELDPSSDWVIASRGETYRQMGRYEQALADLGKAIELNPGWWLVIAQRGETYRQMGRYEQALADLGKAIEIDPSNDWIYYLQSRAHLCLGQNSQAHTYLRNAVDQVRKNIVHRRAPSNDAYNLAVYLAAEGRFDEAKQELQDALATYPKQSWELEVIDDLRDLASIPGVDSPKVGQLIEFMSNSIPKQTLT